MAEAARALIELGLNLLATRGTAQWLTDQGIEAGDRQQGL